MKYCVYLQLIWKDATQLTYKSQEKLKSAYYYWISINNYILFYGKCY